VAVCVSGTVHRGVSDQAAACESDRRRGDDRGLWAENLSCATTKACYGVGRRGARDRGTRHASCYRGSTEPIRQGWMRSSSSSPRPCSDSSTSLPHHAPTPKRGRSALHPFSPTLTRRAVNHRSTIIVAATELWFSHALFDTFASSLDFRAKRDRSDSTVS
jgi:hypothetical protein